MVYMELHDYKSWKIPLIRDEEMSNEVCTNKTEALSEQYKLINSVKVD